MKHGSKRPVALTIAGGDPGGGAGLQADLKTFAALGVYGYSALTAVIAQNSSRLCSVRPVSPAMVCAQIEAVAAELRPGAVKTGALASAAVVRAVAGTMDRLRLPAAVVDPVLVSTSGTRLLSPQGERAMRTYLLPMARVVTPNIPEAEALAGMRIRSMAARRRAARKIVRLGARSVVIKGGHGTGSEAVDLLYDGKRFVEFRNRRIRGSGAHGTGCAYSAAITACLAKGMDLEAAVREAKRFVNRALEAAFRLGRGRSLLDHFASFEDVRRADRGRNSSSPARRL